MDVIEDRRQTLPENSYTTQLFAGGVPRISEKLIEEAQEVIAAATEDGTSGRDHLIHEIGRAHV